MMTHEDMITLIGDLFIDSYIAGDRKDSNTYSNARARRDRMYEEVAELYGELESESYQREQLQVELKDANKQIINLRDQIINLRDQVRSQQEEIERRIEEKKAIFNGTPPTLGMKLRLSNIYGSKLTDTDEEVPDHHDAFDAMFPGCTPDDLPFPDVDDLAPASEVLGGEE